MSRHLRKDKIVNPAAVLGRSGIDSHDGDLTVEAQARNVALATLYATSLLRELISRLEASDVDESIEADPNIQELLEFLYAMVIQVKVSNFFLDELAKRLEMKDRIDFLP